MKTPSPGPIRLVRGTSEPDGGKILDDIIYHDRRGITEDQLKEAKVAGIHPRTPFTKADIIPVTPEEQYMINFPPLA